MSAARDLLERALRTKRRSIVIVGPGKDVGKTVTAAALTRAAHREGLAVALTSVGRDGEARDVLTAHAKPRLCLPAGTIVATAATLLPRSPSAEVLELTAYPTALGRTAIVRLCAQSHVEIGGPNTGSAMRALVTRLERYAAVVIVDGAVDRLAATAGGGDAIVVATGASAAPTLSGVVERTRALIERLTIPGGGAEGAIEIDGALSPSRAAALLGRDDLDRGVIVRDPFCIQLPDAIFSALRKRTRLWCRRPLEVVAATVAAHGRTHDLDPVALAGAVAAASGLPTYDLYRNAVVGV